MTSFGTLVLLAIFTLFLFWGAAKRGFFTLEEQKETWAFPITIVHPLFAFLIYFTLSFFFIPWIASSLRSLMPPLEWISLASGLNFSAALLIFFSLYGYFFSIQRKISSSIWKREEAHSFKQDLWMALYAWILSFPLVLFVSQLFEMLLLHFSQEKTLPEQAAVYFLKMTFSHPLSFFLSTVTIVLLAPLIEELLFRGFLQSFFRQHLGSKQAILLTSFCFSCFHYAPDQGLSNLPIIASLWILSLFLGFVYEKQGSLIAPISLHAVFNGISVINLYFLGDSVHWI